MQIYTVAFFGHRNIDDLDFVEKSLEKVILMLLRKRDFVEFVVGRNGEFDKSVASVIHRIKKNYDKDNFTLTLFLPYATSEYRDNEYSFEEYYDSVDILMAREYVHPKAAIGARNKEMVDCADLIICYIKEDFGGAFKAVKYAKEQNKRVFNLFEETDISDYKHMKLSKKNKTSQKRLSCDSTFICEVFSIQQSKTIALVPSGQA